MKKICLLSDTHAYLDQRILDHVMDCDEVWHAGDIGSVEVSEKLGKLKPLRAVYGNIDGQDLRSMHPEELFFDCEGMRILIIHIGGYPGAFVPKARKKIESLRPDIFICGHSHILKVIPDPKHKLLHMNPGAAGKHGFHKIRTLLKFSIDKGKIQNLEAVELGLRGSIDA